MASQTGRMRGCGANVGEHSARIFIVLMIGEEDRRRVVVLVEESRDLLTTQRVLYTIPTS
jgi:hypothetical protein